MSIAIAAMTAKHADAVAAIFTEGITTGNATFEPEAPAWSSFDEAKLPAHRFVALGGETVLGWTAISPTSFSWSIGALS